MDQAMYQPFPRKEALLAKIKALHPPHDTENAEYLTLYNSRLDLVLDKVLVDVAAFINFPVNLIPEPLDTHVALLVVQFAESFYLFETFAEMAERQAKQGITKLEEGDTSVSYSSSSSASPAGQLAAALSANSLTGDIKRTLRHYRRLQR